MSLSSELASAEWSARRERYIALGILLAATAASSFLILSVVNGLEESIGEEISTTLGGDLRIARNKTGLGDGDMMRDLRDVQAALRFADPDARLAPRIETQAIFLHDGDFSTSGTTPARAAAVLIGMDPAADVRVADVDGLMTQGEGTSALLREWRTPEGERLVPLLVGVAFLDTGNVTVFNGTFTWDSVYNFSAGHVENNRVVRERGIVVGAYETGFRMVDRLVVYAPRGDVARLLGEFPTDPPANVVLVDTADPRALAREAEARGFAVAIADDFREGYLGPVFVMVRAAAWAIVGLLALMTAGWMGYTLAHHVHEDRRKIATLRAVGIPDKVIGRTYLQLAGLLSAGAAFAGVAGATVLSLIAALVARAVGFVVPAPSLVEASALIVLSLAAGLVAVRWAFQRAARISIREALQAP